MFEKFRETFSYWNIDFVIKDYIGIIHLHKKTEKTYKLQVKWNSMKNVANRHELADRVVAAADVDRQLAMRLHRHRLDRVARIVPLARASARAGATRAGNCYCATFLLVLSNSCAIIFTCFYRPAVRRLFLFRLFCLIGIRRREFDTVVISILPSWHQHCSNLNFLQIYLLHCDVWTYARRAYDRLRVTNS